MTIPEEIVERLKGVPIEEVARRLGMEVGRLDLLKGCKDYSEYYLTNCH